MKIPRKEARNLLHEIPNGRIFSVIFIKKDGTRRGMICQKGVTKHLKGKEQAYDPASYSLMTVWDREKEGYRSINLSTLLEIHSNGEVYEVE